MEKVVKIIRLGATTFLGGAVIYLANEGDLGVNLTTILSTASPLVLIVVTYLFEALRYVLPSLLVTNLLSKAKNIFGEDGVTYLKQLANEVPPQVLVQNIKSLLEEFNQVKEDITLIKEKQDNVL